MRSNPIRAGTHPHLIRSATPGTLAVELRCAPATFALTCSARMVTARPRIAPVAIWRRFMANPAAVVVTAHGGTYIPVMTVLPELLRAECVPEAGGHTHPTAPIESPENPCATSVTTARTELGLRGVGQPGRPDVQDRDLIDSVALKHCWRRTRIAGQDHFILYEQPGRPIRVTYSKCGEVEAGEYVTVGCGTLYAHSCAQVVAWLEGVGG
jgi:hypothetical protein